MVIFAWLKQLNNSLPIEPDFPFCADEIAEPRPDMNIKVTAFAETKKLHYTRISAHVFVFIVFAEEEERLVDVYVNLLT